jgi:hypothetical protein
MSAALPGLRLSLTGVEPGAARVDPVARPLAAFLQGL